MSAYPALLEEMMGAILTRDLAPAKCLYRDKKDFPAHKQLAVYVEGYRARLLEVLESAYPALLYYLGRPAFVIHAQACIEATPSRHFNLDTYPIAFGAYVRRESGDVFAGELATLESVIHEIYQGVESAALERSWIEKQTPDSLSASPLLPRAASALCTFTYPVSDYVDRFRAQQNPSRPAPCNNWVMVLRHNHQVRRLVLAEAEYTLLSILSEGKTLGAALEDERFAPHSDQETISADFMGWFARWVEHGVLRQPLW